VQKDGALLAVISVWILILSQRYGSLMRTKLCVSLLLFCASFSSNAEPTNTAFTLYSDGIRLAVNLWLPDGLEANGGSISGSGP